MLGGCGLLIAGVIFLVWFRSDKSWQRVIAWIAGFWALISLGILFIALIGSM